MKKLFILMISIMTAFAGVAPAQAFPTAAVATVNARTDAQTVQYRDRHYDRRHYRDDRRYDRRYDRRDRYSHGRRHNRNNAGAIIGGLAAGAIIGGAIASQNRNSCAQRYRSYRSSDNTYQPSSGPRRVCR